MNSDQGKMIIRQAAEEDARQIADILVEDWKRPIAESSTVIIWIP